MPEEAVTRRSRTRRWVVATIGILLLAIIGAIAWYLQSPQFEAVVRRKVVATLEDMTGGRVELRSFHWNLTKLEFEAHDLTVHGLEGPNQLPYAHVDRVDVRLRIVSFAERRINLKYLGLEHPVLHLIVYPDGTTNAPEPKVKYSTTTPVQQLFELAIARTDLHDGMLLLNDRKIPLDFSADDVATAMAYNRGDHRYDGTVHLGKIDAQYQDFRDVPAQADMEFSLLSNVLQIRSAKLASEKSSLEGRAKITNFDTPRIEFSYDGSFDMGQAGAVARVYQLRSGTMTISGAGTYSQTSSGSHGKLTVRGLDYVDEGLVVRNATVAADFALSNDHLVLSRLAGRLLGGEFTGEADVRNLGSRPAPPQTEPPSGSASRTVKRVGSAQSRGPTTARIVGPGPEQGTARFRVNRLSLSEIAKTFSSKPLPLDKLNPVGVVGGTVDLAWKRTLADADADLALDSIAPPQTSDGQLPVNGSLHGRYNVRRLAMDISALNLTTPHTHLNASGELGSVSADLKVALNTTSLTEFQPLLSALGSTPLPVELAGQASFNGTISGKVRSPQIAGQVQATNFVYVYTPAGKSAEPQPVHVHSKRTSWFHTAHVPSTESPPKPTVPPRRIHIDQFSGDVQYSLTGVALHHGLIQEGSARLNLDGNASLENGSFTDSSPFQVQVALHNADVAALQRVAGVDYPVTGVLNADLQAAGTETNPQGQGYFSLSAAEAYGRPLKSLTSRVVFANHEATFNDIQLQAARGVIEGSAAYNLASHAIKLDLSGENIDLAEIPELQADRLHTAGAARFTLKGSGTTAEPILNGHLQVSSLLLNGEVVGGVAVDAVTRGRQLQITARSDFSKATFSLDGNIELRGDMPGNLTMQFSRLDIDPFLRTEVKGRITGHSSMAGHATLNGPLKQPHLLNGDFRIDAFSVEVEKVPIASDGPIELRLANQVVSVQRCSLTSEDSRLTLTGTASLKDERRLNLLAKGQINLKIVHTLDPDVSSYGTTNLDVGVDGTMANPLVSGRVEIVHGGLSMIDVPAGLGDINGTLVFNQDRLEVEHLTAHTGGGLANFSGFITYGKVSEVDLTLHGKEIRFRYAGISVTSDQSLHLKGTLQNSTLSGDITVTRFAQIPSSDLKYVVAQAGQPARIPNPSSPLNNLRLDVRILSAPELTVQTSLAKLSGGVDLRLRGTAAKPTLLGRINVAEGDIKLGGTKYHLERGDVTFTDPVRIDPVLDIEATTRVRDYDITIGLHGTFEKLNTTYRSDPPLSSADIVALLAFGRTEQESALNSAPQSGFAESASGAMLGQAINQTVTNRVSKLFGVSSIRINPALGGPDNNPNARLTVEQQVSNNVSFTYITNLTRSAQQVIQFEYNINSEYSFQGVRDENGVVSLDLLVRKRKR